MSYWIEKPRWLTFKQKIMCPLDDTKKQYYLRMLLKHLTFQFYAYYRVFVDIMITTNRETFNVEHYQTLSLKIF